MSRYYYFSLINESLMATQKPQILADIDKRFLSAQQNGHKEKKMLLDGLTGLKISVQKENTITANHQPVVRKTESIAAGSGQIWKLACFSFSPSAVRNTR